MSITKKLSYIKHYLSFLFIILFLAIFFILSAEKTLLANPQCSPPNVLVVMDNSSSMRHELPGSGQEKWDVAEAALDQMLVNYDGQINFGLLLFPGSAGQCHEGEIKVYPGAQTSNNIRMAISSPPPDSGNYTPIGQTLEMITTDLNSIFNNSQKNYLLFLTDGWQWCSDNWYNKHGGSNRYYSDTAVERVASLFGMDISTFVVGFGNAAGTSCSNSAVDVRLLNRLATAGGTSFTGCNETNCDPSAPDNCYYQADYPSDLDDAFDQIGKIITEEVCDGIDNDCDGQTDEELSEECENECGTGTRECKNGNWENCSIDDPNIEICDEKDNDCDGITDGISRTCDGNCGEGEQICTNGQWGECSGSNSNPEAEICDGKDNNCDGITDEGCICTDGDVRDCGTDVGNCMKGYEVCENNKWGECIGGIWPLEEFCDGQDSDCDGLTDEGIQEIPEATKNTGVCQGQKQICDPNFYWIDPDFNLINGFEPYEYSCDGRDNDCNELIDDGLNPPLANKHLGVCKSETKVCGGALGWLEPDYTQIRFYESNESKCDGLDDDCDGAIDEGCECQVNSSDYKLCGSDEGECIQGFQYCYDGLWDLCDGEIPPEIEVCDGDDNDCDGITDESVADLPYSDLFEGICQGSRKICSNTGWAEPDYLKLPGYEPAESKCDGIDNDCDGYIDEDLETKSPSADKILGVCSNVKKVCSGQNGWNEPDYTTINKYELTEITCDGFDNDCDGNTDEGCDCNNGNTRDCGIETGECKKGTQTCTFGKWEECQGDIKPTLEICDGIDNNCDGNTDENCSCRDGDSRQCGSDIGNCSSSWQNCAQGRWESCRDAIGPEQEMCDDEDNNCNGTVDEGCECLYSEERECGIDEGICQKGTQYCNNGRWGDCSGSIEPQTETCDGEDNDCDGLMDESCNCDYDEYKPCGTDTGECEKGWQYCILGNWGECEGEDGPEEEICDGYDNDCDNIIDEDCECLEGDSRECGIGVGVCTFGTQDCVSGKWGQCRGSQNPGIESCDSKDNDCDGVIDEGCMCSNDGESRPCGLTIGVCEPGWQYCRSSIWGHCEGSRDPSAEICDNQDNNCDGMDDNGAPCPDNHTCINGNCADLSGIMKNTNVKIYESFGQLCSSPLCNYQLSVNFPYF